jgi:probable F420-dependent oxidoreductase
VRFGVALPHYTYSLPEGPDEPDAVVAMAQLAEQLGYYSVWVSDHFFRLLGRPQAQPEPFGALEPLATLGAVSTATQRIRLGTLVLCTAFRHPALVAKSAATIDRLSRGRLELGLGAGWYEPEFQAIGVPFGSPRERLAGLEDAAKLIAAALESSGPMTLETPTWRLEGYVSEPGPVQTPRPTIWIGGNGGPVLMRVVARAADGWNTVWRFSLEEYEARLARLRRACDAVGRDPASVRLSVGQYCLVGRTHAEVERAWERSRRLTPANLFDDVPLARFAEGALVGTYDECAERIHSLEALGVESIVLNFAPLPFATYPAEQLREVASEVIPRLGAP